MNDISLVQWLVTGFTTATFVSALTTAFKFAKWTGIVDTRLDNNDKRLSKAHSRIDRILSGGNNPSN